LGAGTCTASTLIYSLKRSVYEHMNKRDQQNMEITSEYWSKYIAFSFVSNGFSFCTNIVADDTVLVQLEATVPVVTVHSYRLC